MIDVQPDDIAALLRLAAEVGEMPRNETVRRRHIVESLRQLVGGMRASCLEHDEKRPGLVSGTAHVLQAPICLVDGKILILEIHRSGDDRPFSDRERQLVHLFTSSVPHLFACSRRTPATTADISMHDPRMDDLPPRLRPVLRQLLAGDAEKQVALKLGLSPHTVHQYAKLLHRHFKVSSRAELLLLFLSEHSTSPSAPAAEDKMSSTGESTPLPW